MAAGQWEEGVTLWLSVFCSILGLCYVFFIHRPQIRYLPEVTHLSIYSNTTPFFSQPLFLPGQTNKNHLLNMSRDSIKKNVRVPELQGGKHPRWPAGREAPRSLAWSRPAGSLWSGHAASQTEEASRSPWGQWSWGHLPPTSWEELQALQHNTHKFSLSAKVDVFLSVFNF